MYKDISAPIRSAMDQLWFSIRTEIGYYTNICLHPLLNTRTLSSPEQLETGITGRQTKSTASSLDSSKESLAQNNSRQACCWCERPDFIGVILRRTFDNNKTRRDVPCVDCVLKWIGFVVVVVDFALAHPQSASCLFTPVSSFLVSSMFC